MTNVADVTPEAIEALQADTKKAQEKVTALKAAMANDAAAIMAEATKSSDYSTLTARGEEIKAAEQAVTRATAKLDEASRNSRWENLAEARKPIEDVLSEMLRDAKPVAAVTDVKGVAKVNDDGTVTVSLTPVIEKLDMAAIEAAVAEAFNGEAFKATNVMSVEINVLGIGKSNASVNLRPTANVNLGFRNKSAGAGSTSGKALAFEYKGNVLGSRAFIEAVVADGHPYATKRAKTVETALGPTGNGLSSLAKDFAKELGIEAQEAAPAA